MVVVVLVAADGVSVLVVAHHEAAWMWAPISDQQRGKRIFRCEDMRLGEGKRDEDERIARVGIEPTTCGLKVRCSAN